LNYIDLSVWLVHRFEFDKKLLDKLLVLRAAEYLLFSNALD